jgi:hypothetical protein
MPDREIALAILAVNDADDLDHARQLIADHGQHFENAHTPACAVSRKTLSQRFRWDELKFAPTS